jgi:hypothetical protein
MYRPFRLSTLAHSAALSIGLSAIFPIRRAFPGPCRPSTRNRSASAHPFQAAGMYISCKTAWLSSLLYRPSPHPQRLPWALPPFHPKQICISAPIPGRWDAYRLQNCMAVLSSPPPFPYPQRPPFALPPFHPKQICISAPIPGHWMHISCKTVFDCFRDSW